MGVPYEANGNSIPGLVAGSSIDETSQYRFVKITGENTVDLCGAGEAPDGILNDTITVGKAAQVFGMGSTRRVEAGSALAAGDELASDATGRAVVAGVGDFIVGRAHTAVDAAGEHTAISLANYGVKA